jgi:hypothetical protein
MLNLRDVIGWNLVLKSVDTDFSYTSQDKEAGLWSFLRDIPHGFFLTVETGYPLQGAVTQDLYAQGWSGINITADANGYEMAQALRPDDRNIYAHVAESETISPQNGVGVLSLEAICRYYAPAVFELLHLGETADKAAVIRSLQWQLHRPRVVLVQLDAVDSLAWEALLTQHHYCFMQHFGRQRVYLAAEQLNVLMADLVQCHRDAATLAQQHEVLKGEQERILNELQDVYGSKAWRITLPLRLVSHYGKELWRQLRNRLAM